MYSSAPIKDRRHWGFPAAGEVQLKEWNMIGMVARWGHNTLLIGFALMTCAIFVTLFR